MGFPRDCAHIQWLILVQFSFGDDAARFSPSKIGNHLKLDCAMILSSQFDITISDNNIKLTD